MSAVFSRRPWGRNECVTNEPQRTSAGRLIKSLIDRANLKMRLGLRFTKIRKRPVIGERKCRLCLADVRGGEINA